MPSGRTAAAGECKTICVFRLVNAAGLTKDMDQGSRLIDIRR